MPCKLTDGDARALDRAAGPGHFMSPPAKPLLQQKRKAGWTSERMPILKWFHSIMRMRLRGVADLVRDAVAG